MKDKIYTIPISDAFASPCICPFCTIKETLEAKYIDSTVGASMMEPDFRIRTNELGFCYTHFNMLNQQGKALSLALIVQTHLEEKIKTIFSELPQRKRSLFVKEPSPAENLVVRIDRHLSDCYICNRISDTMLIFFENTVYMWDTELDFKSIFSKTPSFCMEHFSALVKAADKHLTPNKADELINSLFNKQRTVFENLYKDVTAFANSFDYRNSDPLTKDEKTAVRRAIDLL